MSAMTTDFLTEFAETRRYSAGRPQGAVLTPDSTAVLFLRSAPRDVRQTLFELDLESGVTRELLAPEALLKGAVETLSVAEKAALERQRSSARGFGSFRLSVEGSKVLVTLSGRPYVLERSSGRVTELNSGPGVCLDAKFSPDGSMVGFVRENDVYVIALAANVERPVTRDGSVVRPHGLAEFVAQEEMHRFEGFWFSPDSAQVLFQTTDHAGVEQMAISDPMRPQAEPNRFFYPRPGQRNAVVTLQLATLATGQMTPVQWSGEAMPYLATVKWPKHGRLSLLVQNREQTKTELLAVDASTGATSVLVREEDPAWVNVVQAFPRWVPDGSGFFWLTERHGGPEVELRAADGRLVSSWVGPERGFGHLVGYDAGSKTLLVEASVDPTRSRLCRVSEGQFDEVTLPWVGAVTFSASMTESSKLVLMTVSALSHMPKTVVLRANGQLVAEVPSVALEPSMTMSTEVVQLEGGHRPWAQIIRPSDFVAGQKYPVVLSVYGGPGIQTVVQALGPNLQLQWLANQGFVVVKLDGRGTPRRGRAWERAISHDFATVPAADQLAGLAALGATFPELDLGRVGVYGWSFGGYMAALLGLAHPKTFRYAVAGAPVVDWFDYDTHYTERYLGVPGADSTAYEVSSLLSYVKQETTGLLLMHGTADDNVYFSHSLKLSDALFRAGFAHELLALANLTHMVPEPLVMQRQWQRIARAFKENL